jgi:class 3 adenylate cyclase/tetratricopeptide (TPR) repeat protein
VLEAATKTLPAAHHAEPVAERRLVSVLFADLVGFTTFSEAHDAEDVQEMQGRYFEVATQIVTRHGGTIEKFIGDAVMAVWGTPTAHEDDAERAVRAGLELVAGVPALAPGLEARCGVTTGEAAVMLGAANQGMVTGDIVNTAARLQSAAAPSTMLVGEATFRAASGAIAFEAAGALQLKGKAEPVPTWQALRVVSERGGRGRIKGIEAPFVGRDVELRLLKELFHGTGSESRVRHISIVGTGGIGKSRLAWELQKYIDGIDEPVYWHRGRSPAYGQGITFWSLGEMIRGRAGLAESDDDATTRARLDALVDEWLANHPDRERIAAALLQVLGFPGGPPPDELFSAWRAFFERLAESGTVVLVFEDLHWADSGTIDFIDHIIEWSHDRPILVLSLARPELLDRRPEWGAPRRGHTSIVLEPLAERETRRLLAGLVPDLPAETSTAIASRAAGIPLYVVEMVRMLLAMSQVRVGDSGILEPVPDAVVATDLALPETLTALISARLDALSPEDRALVLDAAVLGQSFAPAGLAAVARRTEAELDPQLRGLVRHEILSRIRDTRSPERGQYVFVQALIREVAYRTLAKRDRVSRHLAVARWLEGLADPELAAAVAGHLVAATGLMAPSGEADAVSARARRSLRSAGDRAAALGVPSQAASFYDQALAMGPEIAEEADLLELAGAAELSAASFDASERHLTRAVELRRRLGDRAGTARATAGLARDLLQGRRYGRAQAVLEPAIVEFADLPEAPAFLELESQQARALFLTGEVDLAIELGRSIIERAASTDDVAIQADALITVGSALAILGRHAEGRPMLRRARELAEANGLSQLLARASNNEFNALSDEDPAAAWDVGLESLALATRLGQRQAVHSLAGALAGIAIFIGHWDDGEALAAPILAETTDPLDRIITLGSLTTIWLLRGRDCEAEVGEVVATSRIRADSDALVFRDDVLGYVALVEGRLDDARVLWRPIAGSQTASGLVSHVAHLDIWRGDAEAAERTIREAAANLPDAGGAAVIRVGLAAGISGLRGDRVAALAGYATLGSRLREYRLTLEEVLFAIDMVHVVGASEEVAQAQIDVARATINRLGSPPLQRLLDEALRVEAHPTTTPAASAAIR